LSPILIQDAISKIQGKSLPFLITTGKKPLFFSCVLRAAFCVLA